MLECSELQSGSGEEAARASLLLPEPSEAKETVRVFLRVKPKTEEEQQIWESAQMRKRASLDEEEDLDKMVKIESGHQVRDSGRLNG